MITRKVLLLFLCGLAAGYLALFHQPQPRVVLIKKESVNASRHAKLDRRLFAGIAEISRPAVPHLSDKNWRLKAIEHQGDYSYVVADVLGEKKQEGSYRFLVKHQGTTDTTVAAYLLTDSGWKLIYGKDPMLEDQKLLGQRSPQG